MSVHVIDKTNGDPAHEVRWRTLEGQQRSARFESEGDAAGFDEAVRARLALERAQRAWRGAPDRWRSHVQRRLADYI